MKENSDEKKYGADTRIDELLNSFIDGELTAAQQAEVEHLVAQNVQAERRLRQLQRCKLLVGSLPCAEVPFEVLEGIRTSLSRMTMPGETGIRSVRAGKRHLLARRVLSTAAMIGLVAVLASVIYTIVTPQATPQRPAALGSRQAIPAVASLGFSGRLELKTDDLTAVGTFVNRAIEDRGLSDTIRQDRYIYSLSCNMKEFNALLADLEMIWPQLDAATLFVNTEIFGRPVAVNNVTTGQIARIAGQDNPQKRIEVAKDFDAVNTLVARLPGREIASAIEGQNNSLVREWRVPKPVLTSPSRETAGRPSNQTQEQETIRLTIVVNQ